MAESQTAHRQSLELKNVTSTILRAYIGQVSALLIGLVGLAGVLFAISKGQQWAASVIAVSDIGSLVGVYLKGSSAAAGRSRSPFTFSSSARSATAFADCRRSRPAARVRTDSRCVRVSSPAYAPVVVASGTVTR
jgi:hypothetical protein